MSSKVLRFQYSKMNFWEDRRAPGDMKIGFMFYILKIWACGVQQRVLLFVFLLFNALGFLGRDWYPAIKCSTTSCLKQALNPIYNQTSTQNANENLWVTKGFGAHLVRGVPPCTSVCFHHSFYLWQHWHLLSSSCFCQVTYITVATGGWPNHRPLRD